MNKGSYGKTMLFNNDSTDDANIFLDMKKIYSHTLFISVSFKFSKIL